MTASVVVRAAGKRYTAHPSWWPWGQSAGPDDGHWAIRDVSFELGGRESVGVIGMNGAGKSTLLRLLAGTTRPTVGTVEVSGRVAALLELGLGMHPEFSGWENARLLCQLMGLDEAATAACLPGIQAFSELGTAMDHPLRTYSTGMQVRLAFSAATALCPDILIVDEALAVGDAYFQHKSLARIRAFQERGVTLLFVTHDAAALKAVCRRALLLDGGRLVRDGPVDAVFDYYNAVIAQKAQAFDIAQSGAGGGPVTTRSGTRDAEILAVEMTDPAGAARRSFHVGEAACLRYRVRTNRAMASPTAGFIIRDRLGTDVFGTNTYHLGVPRHACEVGGELAVTFAVTLSVGPGTYSVSAAVHEGADHREGSFDWWDRALVFDVLPGASPHFVGLAALPAAASVHPVATPVG